MAAARSASRPGRSAPSVEPLHHSASTLGALLVGSAKEGGGMGVTVRRHDQDVVERGERKRDVGVHREPHVEERGGVLSVHHPPHLCSVPDGDRFVVAGQRPVERELSIVAFPPTDVNTVLRPTPGVRRWRRSSSAVAAFGEERRGRVDDPAPGGACLLSRSADWYGRGSPLRADQPTPRET